MSVVLPLPAMPMTRIVTGFGYILGIDGSAASCSYALAGTAAAASSVAAGAATGAGGGMVVLVDAAIGGSADDDDML